ncbi:RNA 2',3'-cyclic phosphodiesterase [Deinococcus ruber]|uniref:RNA 2',3'-cyclic phosphodiesterase n=1 Tax=Deinococcus ruber TaxID=1848197 RepID=A0A918CLZ7_9DEIO|nr:RNA 2',3'-cyclic phosphodiesterase [Deinococcus ruber]GGR29717.1 RNA 2',3'-cyclic phosphodiesterase [Deinococcus ruber]
MRLFFAVELPAALASELAAAQQKLSQNWRRVEAQQLHITLAYLPGVPQNRVAELRALGERLAGSVPPLALRLRGTGYHPNVGSPRVWFVKVEGEGLLELAARFQAEVEALGFPTEGAFQPHITLARKKGPAPRVPPVTFAQSWTAPQFSLIHTFLPRDKTGPVYDTVSRFVFRGQPSAPPVPTEALIATEAPITAVPIPEEDHGKAR